MRERFWTMVLVMIMGLLIVGPAVRAQTSWAMPADSIGREDSDQAALASVDRADEGAKESPDRGGQRFWIGIPARDAVLLGLWSKHFHSTDDYRTRHNLIGVQYQGYFLATFANSYSRQIYAVGVARTIWEKDLGHDWRLDAGYKVGPMYGYREGAPNLAGFSVLPVGCIGLTYHRIGIDLNLVPGNALSVNFRIEF